jgi:hypothetical protein
MPNPTIKIVVSHLYSGSNLSCFNFLLVLVYVPMYIGTRTLFIRKYVYIVWSPCLEGVQSYKIPLNDFRFFSSKTDHSILTLRPSKSQSIGSERRRLL